MIDLPAEHVTVNDVSMAWSEAGTGIPVVLVHGNYASRRWYSLQLADPPEGHRLIAPDLPNFGESDALPGDISMEAYAGYVLGFADALGLGEFVLVGHRLGGSVVQTVAVTAPERVSRLLLIGSSGPAGHHTTAEHLQLLEAFKGNRKLLGAALKTTIPTNRPDWFDQLVDDAMQMQQHAYTGNALALMKHDISSQTRNYPGDVLVIRGELDLPHLITDEIARQTAAAYPNGRLLTIPGVGHSPQLEDAEMFRRVFGGFLKGEP